MLNSRPSNAQEEGKDISPLLETSKENADNPSVNDYYADESKVIKIKIVRREEGTLDGWYSFFSKNYKAD